MPFTNSTQVSVVSYANLGGLGSREGTPVACEWKLPPPPPPWSIVGNASRARAMLALLLLLPLYLLERNRRPAAGLIGLLALLIAGAANLVLTFTDQETATAFAVSSSAVAIGLAGVWLLAPWLGCRHRWLTFLKTLGVMVVMTGAAIWPALPLLSTGGFLADLLKYITLTLTAFAVLALTWGLCWAAFSVRRHFTRWRFLLWLVVWLLGLDVALVGLGWLLSSSGANWDELLQGLLAGAMGLGLCVLWLLPYLLLSFFHPFHRERFFTWLGVGPGSASALAGVVPPTEPVTAASTSS